jgi:hypothetical protein
VLSPKWERCGIRPCREATFRPRSGRRPAKQVRPNRAERGTRPAGVPDRQRVRGLTGSCGLSSPPECEFVLNTILLDEFLDAYHRPLAELERTTPPCAS